MALEAAMMRAMSVVLSVTDWRAQHGNHLLVSLQLGLARYGKVRLAATLTCGAGAREVPPGEAQGT